MTSTPNKADVTHGDALHNLSGYDGLSPGLLVNSFASCFKADLNTLGVEKSGLIYDNTVVAVQKYVSSFFDRMNQVKNSKDADQLAESAKLDWKSLEIFISNLFTNKDLPVEDIGYGACKSGYDVDVTLLSERCPWYVSSKFAICLVDCDLSCIEKSAQLVEMHIVPRSKDPYQYLWKASIQLFNSLKANLLFADALNDYQQLFLDILSIGKIYEMMNPTGDIRLAQEQAVYDMLTSEEETISDEDREKFNTILNEVFDDINDRHGPVYCEDIRNALCKPKVRSVLESRYDERDYYLALTASPMKCTKFPGLTPSLLKSCFEYDPIKDIELVRVFDTDVGYVSWYIDQDPSVLGPYIKTVSIFNGGKYKIRIIHLACNAIQDRCNYIQHRIATLLDAMLCDCTTRQMEGVRFIKNLTEWWYKTDPSKRWSIFGADYSNATDTLSQDYQCKVLEFVMNKNIANFWMTISQMEKEFYFSNGEVKRYRQKSGQPQGLKGSFPAFALAHHVLMLMLMKMSNLTGYPAVKFYRVLGDDLVFNSINASVDSSTLWDNYQWLCKCTNLKLNASKCTRVTPDSEVAMVDFAKVTVVNGEVFTPTPFRLFGSYASSDANKIAVAIWRLQKEVPRAEEFWYNVLDHLEDKNFGSFLRTAYNAGKLEFLTKVVKEPLSNEETGLLTYVSSIIGLRSCLESYASTDKEKQRLFQPKDGMDSILKIGKRYYSDLLEMVTSTNHKIWGVLEKNLTLSDIINRANQSSDDDEERILSLIVNCASLNIEMSHEEESSLLILAENQERFQEIVSQGNLGWFFAHFGEVMPSVAPIQDVCERLMIRGSTKRPAVMAVILQTVFKQMETLADLYPEVGTFAEYLSCAEAATG